MTSGLSLFSFALGMSLTILHITLGVIWVALSNIVLIEDTAFHLLQYSPFLETLSLVHCNNPAVNVK